MSARTLYDKIGFESIEKIKEYGKFIGKDYTRENIHDGYSFIFNKDVKDVIKRREPLLANLTISTIIPNKVWSFGCILVIGSNLFEGVENKVSNFEIPLGPVDVLGSWMDINKRSILQITPNQNYYNTETQLIVNIMERNIIVLETGIATLKLTLNTTAKSKQWDNNEASVYLSVSIYEIEVSTFKAKDLGDNDSKSNRSELIMTKDFNLGTPLPSIRHRLRLRQPSN
jgi:hypothetical protein